MHQLTSSLCSPYFSDIPASEVTSTSGPLQVLYTLSLRGSFL